MKKKIKYIINPDPKRYPYVKDGNFMYLYVNMYYSDFSLGQGKFRYINRDSVRFLEVNTGDIASVLSLTLLDLKSLSIKCLESLGFFVIKN